MSVSSFQNLLQSYFLLGEATMGVSSGPLVERNLLVMTDGSIGVLAMCKAAQAIAAHAR